MKGELRKDVRFEDFGRVECNDLCPFSGVLDDISISGCKIHYDTPVNLDMDKDYELRIRLSRATLEPLDLVCHPQWQKQMEDSSIQIGFLFLTSPDTVRLNVYINHLHEEEKSSEIDSVLPEEEPCQFV